jgi:putative colanic acid biosynthesis glycosyltransferase
MISVITINYNNLPGLIKTTESLLGQSDQSYEWIVIDGASCDGSVHFAKSIIKIDVLISETDAGIYDAMLKGLGLASSDFVVFLNSGDILSSPYSLSDAKAHINQNIDAIFFDAEMLSGKKRWIRRARTIDAAKYTVPAVQQATLYRRSKLREAKWPTAYRICGDYYIAAQMLKDKWRCVAHHQVFCSFEVGGVSTVKFALLAREAMTIQKDVLGISFPVRVAGYIRRISTGLMVKIIHSLTKN